MLFYVIRVPNPDGYSVKYDFNPTKHHSTYQFAREEAIRLAKLYPGSEFMVVKAISNAKLGLIIETNYE